MSRYYIGIDNGLDGGVACLDADGRIMWRHAMPTQKTGKGRVVDIIEVSRLLQRPSESNVTMIVIEEPIKMRFGTITASTIASTWFTYGQLVAACRLYLHRYHTVSTPSIWQKMFWTKPLKAKNFNTKAAAHAAALKLWPHEDFLKSDKSRVPHDGIVDALLIAEYGRRRGL